VVLGGILSVGLVLTVGVLSDWSRSDSRNMGGPNKTASPGVLVWQGVLDRDMDTQHLLVGHGLDTMIIDNQGAGRQKGAQRYVATFPGLRLVGLTALLVLFVRE